MWAVSHYSTDVNKTGYLYGSNDGVGYVFGYTGDGSKAVLQQYAYVQAKVRSSVRSQIMQACRNKPPRFGGAHARSLRWHAECRPRP